MFLKNNYGVLSTKEIAEKLNRTENSVIIMVRRLKITNVQYRWSDEEIEILKKYYPLEGKKVANRLPYKTEKQCLRKAYKLGLVYIGKSSKYKYVSWSKQQNKWKVEFCINGKAKYFGSFDNEDEAGRVALEKAREYGKAV